MAKLFLFDIDGTILTFKHYRSREIFSGIIKNIFNKEVKFESLPNFAGMTDLYILKEIAREIDYPFEDIKRKISQVWTEMYIEFEKYTDKEHIILMPGIVKLLSYLRDKKDVYLGLCTGNFYENAYLKLRTYSLDKIFPYGSFGSDHADRNKLPPIAVERANTYEGKALFNSNNTIIVGDSPLDIECAKANDMKCISVCTGYFSFKELNELKPDILLKDFSDINKTRQVFDNLSVSDFI